MANAPEPPSGITGVPETDHTGAFDIAWGTAAGTVDFYQLQQKTNDGSWTKIYQGTGLSKAVSGLADGRYTFRVRACNTVSTYTACSGFLASDTAIVADRPETPAAIEVSPSSTIDQSHTATWEAASGPVDSYQLHRKVDDGDWTLTYEGPALSQTFSDLVDGIYTYRVRACSHESGYNACSDDLTADSATVAYVAAPTNLSLPEGATTGAYTVSWDSGGGSASHYTLQERIDGGSWETVQDSAATSLSFSSRPDAVYDYRVRACNAEGCTSFTQAESIVAQQVGVPGSITGPSNLEDEDDFTLEWGEAGGTVTHYQLQEQAGRGDWNTVHNGPAVSTDFTNHNYGTYHYRVRACNDVGCSAYTASKTVSIVLTQPPQPAPAPYDAIGNAASLVFQADVDGTDAVGSVSGKFRVNESGAATYSVPIATAPGTAGVEPQISLNYSSQGGNGLVGLGWSLDGLSAISRCRQTLHQDRKAKPITWTSEDRFCLDGQRLIKVSGTTYGAPNSTYRTELDNFATVTARGGTTGNPSYFEVSRKDGSKSYYGNTGDSAQTAGNSGKVMTWAINKFEDSVGNPIWFIYHDDAAGQRISEIRYAYGSNGGPSGHGAHLAFAYENRSDPIAGYVAGHEFRTGKRLTAIRTYSDGTLLRRYTLDYKSAAGSAHQLSRLASIQECTGSNTCREATTFQWVEPVLGFAGSPTSQVSIPTQSDQNVSDYKPIDINGDGRMDLVWNTPSYGDSGVESQHGHYVIANDSGGFGPIQQVYTDGGDASAPFTLEVVDYNGDGRQDVAVYMHTSWKIFLAQPQADGTWKLSTSSIATPVTQRSAAFGDLNSDGMVDVVYTRGYSLYVRHLLRDGSQPVTSDRYYKFGPESNVNVRLEDPIDTDYSLVGRRLDLQSNVDFNGDGNTDLLFEIHQVLLSNGSQFNFETYGYTGKFVTGKKSGAYDTFHTLSFDGMKGQSHGRTRLADFNGDGLTDTLQFHDHLTPNPDGSADARGWFYRLSRGTGLGAVSKLVSDIAPKDQDTVQLVDYNNDGNTDIVWHDSTASKLKALLWDPAEETFKGPINVRNTDGNFRHSHLFMDVDGDGILDYVSIKNDVLRTYPGHGANQPRNVITKISNGLDANTDITYKPLSTSGHYSRVDVSTEELCFDIDIPIHGYGYVTNSYCTTDPSQFYADLNGPWDLPDRSVSLGKHSPVLELNGPMAVVTRVQSSAPTAASAGAKSAIRYYYGEAKIQASGRGLLGFHKLTTEDEQSGVRTVTTYRQDWPFIGYPLKTEVFSSAGHKLRESENTWDVHNINDWNGASNTAINQGTAALGSLQPYIKESVEKTYDLDGNDSPLKTVTTRNTYDDYGNPTRIEVTTSGGGRTFQTLTENEYQPPGLDPIYSREKGRLSDTVVTHNRDEDGDGSFESSAVRTSSFEYYASGPFKGLLHRETVEPGSAYATTTTHGYDSFGNTVREATSAGGETRCDVDTAVYDSRGRYVDTTYDCLGRKTSAVVDRNAYGAPREVWHYTDQNGTNAVATYYRYTAGGIRYFEADETGDWQASTLHQGGGGLCPTGTAYYKTIRSAGGGESRECFDRLGRSVATFDTGFDGQWIVQRTQYDKSGRVQRQSEPHYRGRTVHWTTMTYDLLDRVTQTALPDGSYSTIQYNGLSVISTNSLGQKKTEVRNVLGERVRVTDHLNGTISYQYDAQGNLSRTTDNAGNATVISYDLLGRKVAMTDPDKGSWTYQYNGFGELIEQTDAQGQRIVMTYDGLGRMIGRQDYRSSESSSLEGNATWSYDTAPNGLGQLDFVQDTTSGYLQARQYDAFGRPSKTITTPDLNDGYYYYEKVTYDQYGRTFQVFDAARASDNYSDNGVEYRYNAHGYRHQLADAVYVNGQTRSLYQKIQSMDARGNVTAEILGNDAATVRQFEADTGRISRITTTSQLGSHGDLQDLQYQWDSIGNLTSRSEQSGSKNLTESFSYDGLNRLTSYTVSGQGTTTVSYDSLGNITGKSDVGSYTYGDAGPHAVTEAGGTTYEYDANGNNTASSDGRTITYTVFDKAKTISKDGHTTEFEYGPDRKRFRRVDTGSAGIQYTLYVGSVEIITRADGSHQVRRTIGGIAIETENYTSTGTFTGQQTHYTYKDHLGSLDVITDELGAITDELSFDPWGHRRSGIDWSSTSVAQIIADYGLFAPTAAPTTRGFTGHEMVDEVGVIHMNGRIYDPRLGRFLQADSVLQFPTNTQSYNRYSYVLNNPIRYTDPSGHIIPVVVGAIAVAAGANAVTVGIAVGVAAFGEALSQGAEFADALSAGIISGVAAGAFSAMGSVDFGGTAMGQVLGGPTTQVLAYGTVGGVTSTLQGGKFGHGFISAGVGGAMGGTLGDGIGGAIGDQTVGRVLGAAVVGGTLSDITGGKFANGAATAAFAAIVSAGAQAARKPTPQEVTYARLSGGVHDRDFQGVDGYVKSGDTFVDQDTGLQSALFVNEETGHSVLAFAGTNGNGDWAANINQAFGGDAVQYRQALRQAGVVYQNTGGNVHFVGHSLGGGLAAASAIVTDGSATVFNAAGVHSNTVGGLVPAAGSITHFRSSFDVLQSVNALTPGRVYGEQVSLGAAGWHPMGGVCRAMGC